MTKLSSLVYVVCLTVDRRLPEGSEAPSSDKSAPPDRISSQMFPVQGLHQQMLLMNGKL